MTSNIHPSVDNPGNKAQTFINGKACDQVSVVDRGFCYGDGLFETALVFGNKIPFKQYHWQRLASGCERLKIKLNLKLLDESVEQLLQEQRCQSSQPKQKSVLKIVVTRGEGERGYRPSANVYSTVVVQLSPIKSELEFGEGVSVCFCTHRLGLNPALSGLKHLNRLDNVLASMDVDIDRYHEGLVFDINDNLIEAVSRNVFLVKEGMLITPLLNQCGVAGIMRRLVLEQYSKEIPIDVEEKVVAATDVVGADEVFLVNSISGIWPVNSIEGREISVGSVAAKIHELWLKDIERRSASE